VTFGRKNKILQFDRSFGEAKRLAGDILADITKISISYLIFMINSSHKPIDCCYIIILVFFI